MPTGQKSGERKKTGRPAKYPGAGARITHSLRIKEQTREKLIEAASASGRSISEEMEYRIDRSFEDDGKFGPPHIAKVVTVMSAVLQSIESALRAKWYENELTRITCKEALSNTINMLMPADKPPIRGLLGPPLTTRDQAIADAVEESRVIASEPFISEPDLAERVRRLRAAFASFLGDNTEAH